MSEHRVLDHLGVQAREYDVEIRRYIPEYDQMIATAVGLVRGDVIDLGTGTGALAAAILHAHPAARVKLVDIDPGMLETARKRVATYGDRAELVQASFAPGDKAGEAFWAGVQACDAVVASLALHHIPALDTKRELYRRVYASLRRGGRFVIADAVVHEHGNEREAMFSVWATWMARHGIAQHAANALFAKWAGEDHYVPLATELHLLADAGFARPDCFWKYGPVAVYGAFR